MDNELFDEILNINDPDFSEKFIKAIGLKPGETLQIVTPQFERTDGVIPCLPNDCWEAVASLDAQSLREIGCLPWDEPDENGKQLMVFPYQWYNFIPNGYEITDIFGNEETFEKGKTDDDRRYGCLSFGVMAKARNTPCT